MSTNRRDFLKKIGIVTAGSLLVNNISLYSEQEIVKVKFSLPKLDYDYKALEPFIDSKTMRIHHSKHHKGYTNGLNKTLDLINQSIKANDYSKMQKLTESLSFFQGGYVNHTIFWKNLKPNPNKKENIPTGSLNKILSSEFNSFADFKRYFSSVCSSIAGSGWGVLGYSPYLKKLLVLGMKEQQNFVGVGIVPILMIDVWEHAYYLNYQNNRKAYIEAIWNVVNWEDVERRYQKAIRINL